MSELDPDIEDFLIQESDVVYALRDKVFDKQKFSFFSLLPQVQDGRIELSGLEFNRCKTTLGGFSIHGAVSLSNVLFNQCNFGGLLSLEPEVYLDHVVFKSRSKKVLLEYQPLLEDTVNYIDYPEGHLALDISEFYGDIKIIGLYPRVVKIDPERQVVVNTEKFSKINWKDFPYEETSHWRYAYDQISYYTNCESGIFNMPDKDDHLYSHEMKFYNYLKQQGLL